MGARSHRDARISRRRSAGAKHGDRRDHIYGARERNNFTPLVRSAGTYSIIAYDPDGDYRKEWPRVKARRRQTI